MTSITLPTPTLHTAFTMIDQLARCWAEQRGWTFAEPHLPPADAGLAHLYSSMPLPTRDQRFTPAASLTVGPGTTPGALDPTRHVGVIIEAHALTGRGALSMLDDLLAVIRPDGRPFVAPEVAHGGAFDLERIIGAPPGHLDAAWNDDDEAAVFRVVHIDHVHGPTPLAPDIGPAGTPDGQCSAAMTLVMTGTPEMMPRPHAAFCVHNAGAGATAATVEIAHGTLTLTQTGGAGEGAFVFDLSENAHDTIGELRAAVAAAGGAGAWVVSDVGAADARASADLHPVRTISCLGAGKKRRLGVWA